MKAVLTCAKLCLSLYFDNGIPIKGMPDDCACIEITPKTTLPPLPITLKLPTPKKPEPAPYDDRPERTYDE